MAIDATGGTERLSRIERLIAEYRAAKRRQLLRRAIKLWRSGELRQRLAKFEAQPERVH